MDLNVGQLVLTALNFTPEGTLACNGQLVSTSAWPALFDLLATRFGGNGTSTFGVPNIAPKQTAAGQTFNWVIVAEGPGYSSGTESLVCEVRPLVLPPPPNTPLASNWVLCDGSLLDINNHQVQYALIGTTFGGNGTTNFALPKLAPLGLGNGLQASYYIAMDGLFPSIGCNSVTPSNGGGQSYDAYMGSLFQLPYPAGNIDQLCALALCQGQTLPIATWPALFSLLGTRFGGNGTTNFVLPTIPAVDGITCALLYSGIYPARSQLP